MRMRMPSPSPSPLSLLCALLLCLPLAVIFTITNPSLPTSTPPPPVSAPRPTKPDVGPPLPTSRPLPNIYEKNITKKDLIVPPLSTRVPPRPLPVRGDDDDDDEELFRKASRVNPNPNPIKKIAFLFLTTSPLPLAPLWENFFHHAPKNLYSIYIHADTTFNYTPPFRGVFAGRVIPSKPTRRHSPTLIAATRRVIAHALLHDAANYMFALLSPSCIPLHSFNFTYGTLEKSRKSFIEILKDEPGEYNKWTARGEDVMLPEVKYEDFRIGSQFFVLKRKHARFVVRDRTLWSKFKLPCLAIAKCYPEEHYFPTLLYKLDPRGCVPATLTHVDWRGTRGGHPRMYRKEEVGTELIREIKKCRPRYGGGGSNGSDWSVGKRRDPFLFARKFSPDSIEPLMTIADDVIFKD